MSLPLSQSGGGGGGSSAVSSVFSRTGAVVAAAGDYTWDQLGNAAGALTLANGANATTFNQTSSALWTWSNTTLGSAITTNNSPAVVLAANYWTGAASAQDTWTLKSSLLAGTNGVSTLTFAHSGSSGIAQIVIPAVGSNTYPALVFGATGCGIWTVNTGLVFTSQNTVYTQIGTVSMLSLRSGYGLCISNSTMFGIANNADVANTGGIPDVAFSRLGAASMALGNGTVSGDVSGTLTLNKSVKQSANGAAWTHGQNSELLTLSTIALTTDTVGNLLPAGAIIDSVVCRVTTTLTTTTNWAVGDATVAARFSSANATLTAGTTSVGLNQADQTGTSGPKQVATAKVRVTCTGANPGAGAIRITVFYRQFVAPTS